MREAASKVLTSMERGEESIAAVTKAFDNKKFWEELITYFPLIRHGPHRKRSFLGFFAIAAGM
jgi:hypothetical protein